MIGVKIATVILFGTTAVINSVSAPDLVQFGALGLCAVMVLYLLRYINEMGKAIREKDKMYVDLLERDIKSRDNLTSALKEHPCIANDSRIKG